MQDRPPPPHPRPGPCLPAVDRCSLCRTNAASSGLKSCSISRNKVLTPVYQEAVNWSAAEGVCVRVCMCAHVCACVHACVCACALGEEEPGILGRSMRDSHPESPTAAGAAPSFLRGPRGEAVEVSRGSSFLFLKSEPQGRTSGSLSPLMVPPGVLRRGLGTRQRVPASRH